MHIRICLKKVHCKSRVIVQSFHGEHRSSQHSSLGEASVVNGITLSDTKKKKDNISTSAAIIATESDILMKTKVYTNRYDTLKFLVFYQNNTIYLNNISMARPDRSHIYIDIMDTVERYNIRI